MGYLLLRSPWVHLYLLCLGALLISSIYDSLSRPQATRGRPPPQNATKSPRPVSGPGRRPDEEVEPMPVSVRRHHVVAIVLRR